MIQGKSVKTSVSDKAAPCPLGHLNRQFMVPRPNVLWLSDFTYVETLRPLYQSKVNQPGAAVA
jgi:hypothetical protein